MYKISKSILSEEEILNIIDDFCVNDRTRYYDNERYYYGKNTYILNEKKSIDEEIPSWKIPITYGRKLIDTVAGYMYRTGNIKYSFNNQDFKKEIDRIFTINNEQLKTAEAGKKCSLYGTIFELHYIDPKSPDVPRWTVISPLEIIPIYNYDIDSKLICFIRFYTVKDSYDPKGEDPSHMKVEVYYGDHVEYYIREVEINKKTNEAISKLTKSADDSINLYKVPPLVIYKNNYELFGDVEPVKKLIDSYDCLISDSMNEFDRFSFAYLLLVGQQLDPEDAKNIKKRRVFENLESSDSVKFLTKDINQEFIKYMAEWIREEIHNQSHIPDFTAQQGGDRLSGVALDRLAYDLTLLASQKEELFKQGLYDRFKMIDQIVNITDLDHELITNDIKIIMDRNRPTDMLQNAQVYGTLDGRGLSRKTMIENLVPFVTDADKELKLFEEQQNKAKEQMMLDFEKTANENNDINPNQNNRNNNPTNQSQGQNANKNNNSDNEE